MLDMIFFHIKVFIQKLSQKNQFALII